MKKWRKLLVHLRSTLTLIGLLSLASALFYFSGGSSIKNLLSENIGRASKLTPPSQFSGWIAWWDEENALNSLQKSSKTLISVSPVWYKIDSDGNLAEIPHKLEAQISALAQQANIKLIPAITNDFDPKRVSKVINNSDAFQIFAEDLANLATSKNYQGFDIDWEEISPKDQQAFNLFIQKLSEFLHTYSLSLTVSVHPQTGQSSDREVARSYNLAELSKNADAVKIMAYDFHNQNSNPGAITPLNELSKVLKYTISIIPTEKIILGLPTYGYDWEIGSGKAAQAVTFTEAIERINKNNGQTARDQKSYSLIGSYSIDNRKHMIWFEDIQTISKMIETARETGIYQFSFWRIGAEDPDLWTKLTPNPTPSN